MPGLFGLPGSVSAIILTLVLGIGIIILVKMMWKVAEPNEALLISGRKSKSTADSPDTDESLTFRIVTGGGAMVLPGIQTVRSLKLNLVETSLSVDCVTRQGVQVQIKGSVIFKIGDTYPEIANAARRFLDQQEIMVTQVHSIFSGHLRAIVGNMTVEELISDRETLRQQVREASGTEMSNLGLKIDSMQILEIGDPSGYIENLSAPHIAAARSAARIAQAERDQEATEREQTANIAVAESKTAAAKRQSELRAEADAAQETSSQAGPLARAQAQLNVTTAETNAAVLQATLVERKLEAEVRKPADAHAYEIKVTADANRDAAIAVAEAEARATTLRADANASATRVTGEAEGAALKARGVGEADAIKARGDALKENQDAVIRQQIAENLPAIVAAAAAPIGQIDNLTVLNGAKGVQDMIGSTMAVVGQMLPGIMDALGKSAPTPASDNSLKEVASSENQ